MLVQDSSPVLRPIALSGKPSPYSCSTTNSIGSSVLSRRSCDLAPVDVRSLAGAFKCGEEEEDYDGGGSVRLACREATHRMEMIVQADQDAKEKTA